MTSSIIGVPASLIVPLASAAPAQDLAGGVRDGQARMAGTLPGNLPALVELALDPSRPRTQEERRFAKDQSTPDMLPADRPVRPVRTFQVSLGGTRTALQPKEYQGLANIYRISLHRDQDTVTCQLLGREGDTRYEVTFTFRLVRNQWLRASRTITHRSQRTSTTESSERKLDLRLDVTEPATGSSPP